MSTIPQSIGGEAVTTRLAMRMEDSLQAFAVRAACFIGELDVPYSEEFDGHDFGATHIIAYVGDEPVGALRVRWFQSFAMPERLAVIQRFRGHGIGQLLIERCRMLAEKVETREEFMAAKKAGFAYFQGYFFRRPETVKTHAVPGIQLNYIKMLQVVSKPELEPREFGTSQISQAQRE